MDDAVMHKHIDLYVNEFSVSLGSRGKQAVEQMFEFAVKAGIIPKIPDRIFAMDAD